MYIFLRSESHQVDVESYLPESGDVLFLDESLLVEYDAAILKALSSVALERCVHSGWIQCTQRKISLRA